MSRFLLALALVSLVAAGCDSGNPVAPPPPDGGAGTAEGVTVAVSATPSKLEAGTASPALVRVTAQQKGGAPVADGTEARVSTSLGHFSLEAGKPVQLTSVRLNGGSATVQLFAGDAPGTANILAQVGTSTARFVVPVVTPSPRPVADFTFEVDDLSVLFTEASAGDPTGFEWSFGDGTSSAESSPMHTYSVPGTYTATLKVTSSGGLSSSKSKFVTVGEAPPLVAAFGFESNGLGVLFTDQSTGDPTSWSWDFGDGKTSSERNPGHFYTRAGTYAVGLTVTNVYGTRAGTSKFVTLSLGDPPQADFQFQADGLRVLFTDVSTNKPTRWAWDFGDGTASTAQNPEHAYARAGTYNVTLTAANAAGSSAKSKFVAVSLGEAPQAAFEVQVNGLSVVFLDRSTDRPTSWAWNFGDGATSTSQNPTHTYPQAGSYTVILTASNSAGSGQASQVVTVATTAPPSANFCYQRNGLSLIFTDTSTQSPTAWQWDFGDCATQASTCKSTAQNPGHTYPAATGPQTYVVTLTATNAAGPDTRSKFVTVDTNIIDLAPVCN